MIFQIKWSNQKIAETGLLSTSGLIINNKILSSGKVLDAQTVAELIEKNK